jgi:hypothetical protein
MCVLIASACGPDPLPTHPTTPSPHPAAPSVLRPSASTDEWEALLHPLLLARLPAGGSCPVTSAASVAPGIVDAQGDGPIYAADRGHLDLSDAVRKSDGLYWIKVAWLSTAEYDGPVLIRGQRVDADGVMKFSPGGAELRLSRAGDMTWDGKPVGWRAWPSQVLLPDPGCYAWQIDGATFTDVIWVLASDAPA